MDVSNSGVVTWGSANELWRFAQGTSSVVATNPHGFGQPVTDGTRYVYQTGTGLAMFDGSSETALAGPPISAMGKGVDYVLGNGFVAFTRPAPGVNQVWLRDSVGTETQLTFWGTSSDISSGLGGAYGPCGAIAPNGGLFVYNFAAPIPRVYYAEPGTMPVDIMANRNGQPCWESASGKWEVAIGRELFGIPTAGGGGGGSSSTTTTGAGSGGAGATGSVATSAGAGGAGSTSGAGGAGVSAAAGGMTTGTGNGGGANGSASSGVGGGGPSQTSSSTSGATTGGGGSSSSSSGCSVAHGDPTSLLPGLVALGLGMRARRRRRAAPLTGRALDGSPRAIENDSARPI